MAASDVHYFLPPAGLLAVFVSCSSSILGVCGLWQVLQATPPEWSAATTCGNPFGLALFASWQRAQITAVSGSWGFADAGSSACLPCAPWQASHGTLACRPSFFWPTTSVW